MANTWIVYLADFLTEAGHMAKMAGRARRLADHFGAIVAELTLHNLPEESASTHVKSRRRPGRRPCTGFIEAVVNAEGRIRWICPNFGDNGLISGWCGTPWDMRGAATRH